ncbi:MAG: hypothetical protein U0N16_01985, partial [Desulfovibrio sp.]
IPLHREEPPFSSWETDECLRPANLIRAGQCCLRRPSPGCFGNIQQQDSRVLPKIIVFPNFIAYNIMISGFSACGCNQAIPTKRIVKTGPFPCFD